MSKVVITSAKRTAVGSFNGSFASKSAAQLGSEAIKAVVEESKIEIEKDTTIFEILKQLPGIETKSDGKNQFITSIDGDGGFYIYEVDGKIPTKAITSNAVLNPGV